MHKEIKELWIAALRSGKYKQARRALQRDGQFCCLGVLCDLAEKEKIGQWDRDTFGSISFQTHDDRRWDVLPQAVVEWAGLATSNPETDEGSLAHANDIGVDFEGIATLIEKYL